MEFKGSIEEFRKQLGLDSKSDCSVVPCVVDVAGQRNAVEIEALFAKAPCIIEYPCADDGAMVVLFPSGNVYGVGGCEVYTTLQKLCDQHWGKKGGTQDELNFVNQLEKMLSAPACSVSQSYQIEYFVRCYKAQMEFDDGFLTQNELRQNKALVKGEVVPSGKKEEKRVQDFFVEELESDMKKYLSSVLHSKPKM